MLIAPDLKSKQIGVAVKSGALPILAPPISALSLIAQQCMVCSKAWLSLLLCSAGCSIPSQATTALLLWETFLKYCFDNFTPPLFSHLELILCTLDSLV